MAITHRVAYAAPARGSAASTVRNAASAVSSSPRCSAASPSPKVFCRSAMPPLVDRAVRAWDTERNDISAEPSGGMAPTSANTNRLAATGGDKTRRRQTSAPPCQDLGDLTPAPEKTRQPSGDREKHTLEPTSPTTTPHNNSL